jgi:Threonine dehydrogenase and related Zn-dependent dehydrogenases
MKALKWYGPYDLRVEESEEPRIVNETDALVRPTLAGICGTDLHIYKGYLQIIPGNIIGHEFVGIVEEVGKGVKEFSKGDKVVVSCWVADGKCWYCKRGYYTQCVNINIFGIGPLYGEALQGAHAELVRVPYADVMLYKIPENIPDEKVVMLSDGLPAGYAGIVEGGIKAGDIVTILGFGPIGAVAGMCAKILGASLIIAIDVIEERLKIARELGFKTLNAKEVDVAEEVRNLTDGRGADLVIEAIGGSEEVLRKAIELARRKGTVSVLGFHVHDYNLPAGQLWISEKRLIFSIGDPIRYRYELLELIKNDRIDISKIITHKVSLNEAPKGFELFDKKVAFKVVIKP